MENTRNIKKTKKKMNDLDSGPLSETAVTPWVLYMKTLFYVYIKIIHILLQLFCWTPLFYLMMMMELRMMMV